MRLLIALCVFSLTLSGCGNKATVEELAEGSCSEKQMKLVDKHISGQIDALAKKDWKLAYSFASESFRNNVDIEQFTEIISNRYSMLIENQGYKFTQCSIESDKITQELTVSAGEQSYYLTYRLTIKGSTLGIEGAVAAQADIPVTV